MVFGESKRLLKYGDLGKWIGTPLGWARANLLYDMHKGPPKHGSLAEAALLIIWKARVSEDVAKTRAVAQAAVGGDKATEAFSDFTNLVNRQTDAAQKVSMKDKLDKLKEMKTIKFTPMEETKRTAIRSVRRKDL